RASSGYLVQSERLGREFIQLAAELLPAVLPRVLVLGGLLDPAMSARTDAMEVVAADERAVAVESGRGCPTSLRIARTSPACSRTAGASRQRSACGSVALHRYSAACSTRSHPRSSRAISLARRLHRSMDAESRSLPAGIPEDELASIAVSA